MTLAAKDQRPAAKLFFDTAIVADAVVVFGMGMTAATADRLVLVLPAVVLLLAVDITPPRRDLVHQSPRNDGATRGTFSLRSPVRPNPIGTSIVALLSVEGSTLLVRGLDCVDGTPLIDIKPDRCLFTPLAPPQPGDFEVGDAP